MNFLCHLIWLTFVYAAAGYCPHDKIYGIGNCSYRIHCEGSISGVNLPGKCLEASNDPFVIDVTLNNPEDNEDHLEPDFLTYITTLKITGFWPRAKLTILQYTDRLEQLYLVSNQIETIEGHPFTALNDLKLLNLSYNRLSDIENLFNFELPSNKLRNLCLSHNFIQELPPSTFEELNSLTELDLSHNRISDLTNEPFSNLTNLEVLRLNNNNITNLNGAVNNLHNLKHLYLRGNQIVNIDVESISIIIHLETFDLAFNHLDEIKPALFSRHWRHLDGHPTCKIILANNYISSVPNATVVSRRYARHLIRSRSSVDVLTELDLSKNQISTIEYNAFQSLNRLIWLDLSNNKIIDFVVNADDVAYIRFLNLSDNYISHLYYTTFSSMKGLLNLDLSNNELQYIPKQAFNQNSYLKLVNMTYNDIEKLDTLHINFFHPDGGVLDLSNNGLTHLKIAHGEGKQLSHLMLHSNNISDPSLVDLWYLNDLRSLDMSRNLITELHVDSLRLPSSLSYLDLSCNQIEVIAPSAFLRLGHLTTLRLSNNKVRTIEYGSFRGLPALTALELSDNFLGLLDSRKLSDLGSLRTLSVMNNGIHVIQDEGWFGHKHDLTVYLDGNNFTCEWLAGALNNYNNGYTKVHPRVLKGVTHGHSLGGIPCVPEESQIAKLRNYSPEVMMSDERLLVTAQKILDAIKQQTYYLKKFIRWNPQDDGDKNRV